MKTKFNKNKKYINKCDIFSPYGIINENTVLTGQQWINVLVYDVGDSFKDMFDIYDNSDDIKLCKKDV